VKNPKPWLSAAIVTIAAGVLYFLTAARDIVVGDSPELITAAATLGVAHEPGYPLFTMLGHLFSWFPFGSIPFRINLLSVACHALTVGVIFMTAFRLTRSQLSSAAAALLLAANPVFWEWSLAAEVFPLNDLLAAITILLLIVWRERPQRAGLFAAVGFFSGLALTNHHTFVLLGPAFCWILWEQRARLLARPGLLVIAVGAFFVGLLPYLYIPWASAHHPSYNWGDVSSLSDLIDVVRRKSYGTRHLVSAPGYTGGSAISRFGALFSSFGAMNLVFIALGLISAYKEARTYFWFGIIGFFFSGPLFVSITNLNLATAPSALFVLQRFFLLPQVVMAPFAAFGFLWLTNLLRSGIPKAQRVASGTLVGATALLIMSIAGLNYGRIDQSHNFIERRFTDDLWRTIEPGSILLARGDVAFALTYAQNVEHVRRDTIVVLLPLLGAKWYVRQFRREHPDFVIPFDQYNAATSNLKQIVAANSNRTFCIAGTIGNEDQSLNQDYWPSQRGMLLVVQRKDVRISLQQEMEENEPFFESYHPPFPSSVRFDTFENDIITMYAWPAFRIGNDCMSGGFRDDAEKWYKRALAINPKFSRAREALARLEH
jgi:tetratricopeptide (TPR) repeat protein